jgi:hypothetical protein
MANKKALEFAKLATAPIANPRPSTKIVQEEAKATAASKFVGKKVVPTPMKGISKRPSFRSFIFKPPR